VERDRVAADSAEVVHELTFAGRGSDSVTAYLRRPAEAPPSGLGAVVLVAGRGTGLRAARVVPGPLRGTAVLSVEYPRDLPEELTLGSFLGKLRQIRISAFRMPRILRDAGHFLASEPEVAGDRIALVGVSFGVPFAAAAGRDTVFRGVALHYGGAGLETILEENLPVEPAFLRVLAAELLASRFAELEPARHVDDIAPRPLLLINGSGDTRIPRDAALRLAEYAERAGGPVRHIWIPHDHLMPSDTALMRELADSTLSHFDFLGDPGGGRR
jgi:fermentation-respiration switch protein FrsA (DUF1100 family)